MDVVNEQICQREKHAVRLIFRIHYEKIISNERAQRILERIVIMINEGRFD